MRRYGVLLALLLLAGCGADEPTAADTARADELISSALATTAPRTTASPTPQPTRPTVTDPYASLAALDGQACTTPGEVRDLAPGSTPSYLPTPTYSAARVCGGDGVWARLAASLDQCTAVNTNRYADATGAALTCVNNQLWVAGQTNSGPLTTGTYTVGNDTGQVVPGTYVATDVQSCYWERLDEAGNIIDNNFIDGAPRAEFTVRSSDYALNIDGCGGWTLQP